MSTHVDVHVKSGSSCIASGDASVTVSIGPGTFDVVVDARDVALDGDYLLVVERR